MLIGFFKLTATVLISVFVKGQNPNFYKWPEAESNCRLLVFQIWANLVTFLSVKHILIDYTHATGRLYVGVRIE